MKIQSEIIIHLIGGYVGIFMKNLEIGNHIIHY